MKPIAIVAVSMLLWATSAGAQGTLPFYVSINGAMQVADNDFQDSGTFVEHAEEGRFDTDYSVSHGPALNINGGVKLHRTFGVGVGVTRYSKSTPTQLSGAVPHPFFFDQDRSVSGEVGGLKREEMAIHIRGSYEFPISPRFQVMAFGGPSFFRVKQGMVSDFTYTDAYPYDTATFAGGQVVEAKESKIGFNAGADVAYFFTRQLGVGASCSSAVRRWTLRRRVAGHRKSKPAGSRPAAGCVSGSRNALPGQSVSDTGARSRKRAHRRQAASA